MPKQTETTPDDALNDYVEKRTKELCKKAGLKWDKIHPDTRMVLTIQASMEYGVKNLKPKKKGRKSCLKKKQ